MIRVLHLNDKIELLGGVETYINNCLNHSAQSFIKGFWVGIYKSGTYSIKDSEGELVLSDISFEELISTLKKYIYKKQIDIIHIHSISNPKLINVLSSILPLVRTMHEQRMICPGQGKFWRKSETICDKPFGLHCLYHTYTQGCCNRHPKKLLDAYNNVKFETTLGKDKYEAIFIMSEYMLSEAKKVGFKDQNLILNPGFTNVVSKKNLIDKSNSEKKSILFIGRLSKTKGVHCFIELGLDLLKERDDVSFEIVGDGHDREYFKSMIPKRNNDKFNFHGWKTKEEVQKILLNSYLMIFPSIYPEAFGIAGIEAMMAGKPVVGFDVGGVPTWLEDNVTGYLTPAKNTELMHRKVKHLLENKEEYKRLSKNARKKALEEFNAEKHMLKLAETYKKVLDS